LPARAFNSLTFLFLFLPAVLLLNVLTPARFRNTNLLLASLLFYAWGETVFVLLMLASIGVNYLAGLALRRAQRPQIRRGILLVALTANLGFLAWFKYAGFLAENASALGNLLGIGALEISPVHLPIGISFFTFQALSYVIDAYRGKTEAQRNPVKLALFISLFPQLIAGPIVRYREIAAQIERRILDAEGFGEGVRRFTIGLGKKVLIANTLAAPADRIFALPPQRTLRERRLVRGGLLYAPDLLRLLRLLRHGHRAGSDVWLPDSGELQLSLRCHLDYRVLASLAYFALELVPGLPLHPSGREPPRRRAYLPESARGLPAVRAVARS
jgi:D-alanyl-lipoteichoic acid acyltransferase DltB (MBOAT superfamily)